MARFFDSMIRGQFLTDATRLERESREYAEEGQLEKSARLRERAAIASEDAAYYERRK